MSQFAFDYATLPYSKGGGHADHNRVNWRAELFLVRNRDRVEGRRVLDLACNNGRFSYVCLALGAKEVVGVEARQHLIDEGTQFLQGTGFEDRMTFVKDDLFAYLESQEPGSFDTILCFGFLYHTVRQVDFFRQVARLAPKTVIIDSTVSRNTFHLSKKGVKRPPTLTLAIEDPELDRNTIDLDGLILNPSPEFFEQMFDLIRYRHRRIRFDKGEISDWAGIEDYKKGSRFAYVADRIE